MNTQYCYQHYKVRQAEALRNAQQRQWAQQAKTAKPAATVYRVAQVWRKLVASEQRHQTEPLPMPGEA